MAFDRTDDFCEGCLGVVNLGDDADTTGAVFGQLAGAYYGESGIPPEWRNRLQDQDLIHRSLITFSSSGRYPRVSSAGRWRQRMSLDVERELAELESMSVGELHGRYETITQPAPMLPDPADRRPAAGAPRRRCDRRVRSGDAE